MCCYWNTYNRDASIVWCIITPLDLIELNSYVPVSEIESKTLRNFWTRLDKYFLSFSCLKQKNCNIRISKFKNDFFFSSCSVGVQSDLVVLIKDYNYTINYVVQCYWISEDDINNNKLRSLNREPTSHTCGFQWGPAKI